MSSDESRRGRGALRAFADAVVESPTRHRVDVWCLTLAGPASRAAELGGLLTADEEARLERMVPAARRERVRTAWGARRAILARLLDGDPREVAIARHGRGAPTVGEPDHPVHASLSHSGDLMLLAVSQARRVGADIERMDPQANVIRLARRFFPADEADELASLRPPDQYRAFFRAWTRKEAILKAVGGGVPSRLRSVLSGLTRERGPVPMAGTVWTLYDLAVPEFYAATLAVDGGAVPVVLHDAIGDNVRIK